jgi:hypothetical protein
MDSRLEPQPREPKQMSSPMADNPDHQLLDSDAIIRLLTNYIESVNTDNTIRQLLNSIEETVKLLTKYFESVESPFPMTPEEETEIAKLPGIISVRSRYFLRQDCKILGLEDDFEDYSFANDSDNMICIRNVVLLVLNRAIERLQKIVSREKDQPGATINDFYKEASERFKQWYETLNDFAGEPPLLQLTLHDSINADAESLGEELDIAYDGDTENSQGAKENQGNKREA